MTYSVYAAGTYRDGSAFLLQFESKAQARMWAVQHGATIRKMWGLYEQGRAA